jgi:hypothetical protein
MLQAQGTKTELYNQKVEHGFFAYTRPVYNAAATKLVQSRMLEFFQRHLKQSGEIEPKAPPNKSFERIARQFASHQSCVV